MYKKTLIITDDSTTEYECYSDGTYWNGWANILFTENQLREWLSDSPYDFRVYPHGVLVYFEDEDFLPVIHFQDESGSELTGYSMNGYCFMYKEDYEG